MLPLKITDLTKKYPNVNALQGISFEINPGEVFGLLGPNGAGKTTTIESIVTLEKPTSGTIEVFGKDNQKHPIFAKQMIGFVPQELIQHRLFSVEDILYYYASYFGIRPEKSHVEFLLKRLDLWNHKNKLVFQLSGGMKRRLLIAKALVHKPNLLLLDEPTAGVDVELRSTLWEFVKELKEQGMSILLTTHYLEEAELLCDRIGILNQGKLEAIDETGALIASLAEREVTVHLNNSLPTIDSEYVLSQEDRKLQLRLPSSCTVGHLFNEIGIQMDHIKDLQIKEGTLEKAFQKVVSKK